tara:strand:- start:129 stop:392 length:264 start_codon:yes stop_codon:yes gene_type:complete
MTKRNKYNINMADREIFQKGKKAIKKYSVTLFDIKQRDGYKSERVQIAWRPDWQTSHALLFENPNHINLIPQLLEEAGYTRQKKSVF